jgi:hypothetical protein
VNLAAGFFGGPTQGVQKQPPAFSVEEDRCAAGATIQQMINRCRMWPWQLACHAPTETKSCNMPIPLKDPVTIYPAFPKKSRIPVDGFGPRCYKCAYSRGCSARRETMKHDGDSVRCRRRGACSNPAGATVYSNGVCLFPHPTSRNPHWQKSPLGIRPSHFGLPIIAAATERIWAVTPEKLREAVRRLVDAAHPPDKAVRG